MFEEPAILIVEDEPLIMMEAVAIVEDHGFEPLEAADARSALRILETRTDIAIVFTDINLADNTDGLMLAREIRRRWPPIKLVVSSGRVNLVGDELPQDAVFLPKPYRASELLTTLKGLIENGPTEARSRPGC